MALGKEGSSLTAELNRLAGTTGKAQQGAANTYAGTTGLGVIAALNVKASGSRQPSSSSLSLVPHAWLPLLPLELP